MSSSMVVSGGSDFDLPSLFRLAGALLQAPGIIPQSLRREGEIVAVILAGRELGIPPMVSLRSINVIKGKVVVDASMQLGLMVRAGARVRWLKDGTDGQEAALELSREGMEPYVSKFTWEMAQRAGLTSNDNWKKHTAAMLRARCVSAAARAYMPDVLSGVYVPGELEDEEDELPQRPPQQRAIDTTAQLPAGASPTARALPAGSEVVQFHDLLGALEACTGDSVLATLRDDALRMKGSMTRDQQLAVRDAIQNAAARIVRIEADREEAERVEREIAEAEAAAMRAEADGQREVEQQLEHGSAP